MITHKVAVATTSRASCRCFSEKTFSKAAAARFRAPRSRFYLPTYFFAAFCLAQRLRCASAILFLPAADMVLFFGAPADSDVRGRPVRLVEAVPARRERADCRRAISASMVETMSCVFICVRYQRSDFQRQLRILHRS